jgi:hypothetical protein
MNLLHAGGGKLKANINSSRGKGREKAVMRPLLLGDQSSPANSL